ncbi:hypothetical protein [Curtobacterium sp. 24E2]|nr:hypothetical protein JN350_09865 [Curtobacterium sp. 24E2]
MTAVSIGAWRFTLRGAELADLAYDGGPVLRAIRFVTRDHDWRTADDIVLTRTTDADADRTSGRVGIEASARYDGTEVLRYVLEVTVDGPTLHVDAVGTTTTPFRRNRIGLVVLHSPALAGVPVTARHPSGTVTQAAFPTWIAPHQPAADLSGLDWSTGRVALTLDLAGDVFETEDQRNWTDASFKTYSTPLSEPFPVALDAGSVVHQSLTLRATPDGRQGGTASPPRTSRAWTGRLPRRGRPAADAPAARRLGPGGCAPGRRAPDRGAARRAGPGGARARRSERQGCPGVRSTRCGWRAARRPVRHR